jgi:hypothetical protein
MKDRESFERVGSRKEKKLLVVSGSSDGTQPMLDLIFEGCLPTTQCSRLKLRRGMRKVFCYCEDYGGGCMEDK